MKLGEFIQNFSHNNIIRLHYPNEGGHICVGKNWDEISMDWEVTKGEGVFKDYINHEVIGLTTIFFPTNSSDYPEALNIVIKEEKPITNAQKPI